MSEIYPDTDSPLSPIEDIIEDARNGRMFILVDAKTGRMRATWSCPPSSPRPKR
jgi:hypothetical protein